MSESLFEKVAMSSPTYIPVIGYSRERIGSDGAVLVSPNQVALLHGLLDRPDGVAPSYTNLARASLPYLARYRSDPRPKALLGSMHRLPTAWVERHRVGRRVECALTARGRAIVSREVPARIVGEGPYVGVRNLPSLEQVAIRRKHFGADILPLRFPADVQEWVDEVARGCSDSTHVDRHLAFDRLTSWIEIGDRARATLRDTRTRHRVTTAAQLAELAAANCPISQPTPGEKIEQLRAALIRILAGDIRDTGEYAVFPVRATNGSYAVVGLILADKVCASSAWAGMFQSSDRFRDWLRDERGLLTSMSDLTSLAYCEQLAMWIDE